MFDDSLPGPAGLAEADDGALVAAITGWARVAAAAEARQLAAVAELVTRRCAPEQHPDWACDDWDAAAAEVGAALTIGHGRACGRMDLALTLRDRLPGVGALFLGGSVSERTVTTVAARTALITDRQALAELDDTLAARVHRWGALSQYKLERTIDLIVDRIDPGAVRRTRTSARGREVVITAPTEPNGSSRVYGRLHATDASLLDERLKAMALGVCPDDPRTMAQRRADALGALAAGATVLACACEAPDCPSGGPDARATSVVIHVIAEQGATTADSDPHCHGEPPIRPVGPNTPLTEALAPDPDPAPTAPRHASALILGGPTVPAPLLAELIARGAAVRPVTEPGPAPEARYRPSTALDTFVRIRDISCRFPGCDRPATSADIDHTAPWPAGATHPANLKTYCRKHHLLKTFWPGWTDRQQPDGTLILTTPSGHTYTTQPGAGLLFPGWSPAATAAPTAPPPPPGRGRTLMMPTRRRTRARARAQRIAAERTLNDAHVAERAKPPPY